MREIKFKAFDKVSEKIYDVGYIDFANEVVQVAMIKGGICYGTYVRRLKDVALLQYTGLKDVHGNEIYEGDIVYQEFYDHRVETSHGLTGVVKQEEGVWWIDNEVNDAVRLWSELNLNHIKGNMFENPELLQGGKK
ncbi:putative phage protein (TIGR01671 family) [Bacillus thuringiensis]|uniref:Putative phage protein (TIGR01671 family) n=2 Tax=Bacillus thuringiensis TaxID=1428 RepID=A0A4R4BK46_BACTU|nr:putative phage protein (TIGR01671 family) [Bacillus thuringiensis]TCW59702.1 putative phage protein (TIGR01671 family) [Bacillus thuringiensis]